MSWEVDTKSLLFHKLTREEANELRMLIEPLILHGSIKMDRPAFVAWVNAAGFDDRQALLVYSVAFPQRAALSLVRYALPFFRGDGRKL